MSKVIIFPTDTVYGIGTSIYDKEGIEKIYEIKKRPKDKPLSVLCANLEQIEEIAILNDNAKKLIDKFMPGSLTVIVNAKDNVKDSFKFDTIGIRIPNSKTALKLLEDFGPLATTSVNDSGKPSLNDYNIIKEKYDDLVDMILPPTAVSSSIASTVVSVVDSNVKVLREGEIKESDILSCLK